MEIQQLRYFVEVAQQLSFRAAATKLNISQPSITKQIQILENELNTKLFDVNQRTVHKKVVLTDAGMFFLIEANKILLSYKNAIEGVKKLENKKKVIKIGFYNLIPSYRVLEIITLIESKLKDVELKIIEYKSPNDVEEAIINEEVLIGVSSIREKKDMLEYVELSKGNLQIWVHESHHLAKNKTVKPSQLKNEKFIEIDSKLHNGIPLLDKIFQKYGVSKQNNTVQVVSSFEIVSGLVSLGMGIGVVPSYYKSLNERAIKLDLVVGDDSALINFSQVFVFKKSHNSSIINSIISE